MGKLTERLADSARSGVYRIETVDALEEAAALNSYPLVNVALEHVTTKAGLLDAIARSARFPDRFDRNWAALGDRLDDLSWAPARGYVLLMSGFEGLRHAAPEDFADFLEVLKQAAAKWRERRTAFFVAFVDLGNVAPLAPLYNWHKQSR